MFDNCFLDYESSTKAVKGEPAVEMKVNLRANDTRISVDLGTVYTEKRTFKDFLLSEYSTSDGITVKNTILPDGTRVAESYDAVKREYIYSAFDEKGTLLDERGDMPFDPLSLRMITGEVFGVLRDAAAEKNIELFVEGDAGEMKGVKRLVFEILYKLCDNGIKYGNNGGRVEVVIEDKENESVIKVADNGIGIEKEDKDRAFERFYRADKSHSKKSGGTGLGLSIVKNSVKYLGGRIEIHSKSFIDKADAV